MAKRISFLFCTTLLLTSCNNQEINSPYEDLLSKAPYSELTDSIHRERKNSELYFRRGMLLKKNNNIQPALSDFKKAWELNKKEEYAVAVSSALSSKPDSAIAFIISALKQFPSSTGLQLNLAQSYLDLNKTGEALKVCNDLLAQHPNQLDALEMKAEILVEKNDLKSAIDVLEQAYTYAPFDEQLCYNLAHKYAETKNQKALSLCDSLIKADKKKPEPFYFKGVYYESLGDRSKAISLFDQAIVKDYTFLDAYMDKGKILYEEKKFKEAIKVFDLTLKISTTYADAYFWLGKCQQALGEKQEAKLNYQRAYGLDKNFTEAKDSASRL